MRQQEIRCFSRSFRCAPEQIAVYDLLSGVPTLAQLARVDVVLLGGSGDYSVAEGGDWLPAALEAMQELHETNKPTFASCWGFQAMARAMGGEVVTDRSRAEVGSAWLELTPEGAADPVFGPLGTPFPVQIGHQDIVTRLPSGATLLASSPIVENQAFRFDGKPIYATQFHPELDKADLIARLTTYPEYLPMAGVQSLEELERITPDTSDTEALLRRFLALVL